MFNSVSYILTSAVVAVACFGVSSAHSGENPEERTRAVKAAVAELTQHNFSEITQNPELRRKWWDMIWTAWSGTPDQYLPDFSDFDKTRYFDAPPAPYVHPRVFLRPEQLPELRQRLGVFGRRPAKGEVGQALLPVQPLGGTDKSVRPTVEEKVEQALLPVQSAGGHGGTDKSVRPTVEEKVEQALLPVQSAGGHGGTDKSVRPTEEERRLSRAASVFYKRYKEECRKLYADSPAGQLYQGLIEDRSGAEFDALFQANIYETSLLMMWESLRILIDEDREAGETMARATKIYADRLQKLYDEKEIGTKHYFYENIRNLPDYMKEKTLGDKGYQEITGMFQEYNITLIYDFLYPYMNDGQRGVVRKLISDLSTDLWIHGMGIPDTGGNWGPHHWKGAIAAICIEGEEGYDPDTVKGLRQVMTSFYSGDFTKAGAVWEGLGKGNFGTEGLMVAAQRGWDMAASQPVRRAVSRMVMHSMLPDREHMLSLGGLGSSFDKFASETQHAYVLKYLYPDDPTIDYLYRLAVGEDYQNLAALQFGRHYFGIRNPLRMLIGMLDYDEGRTFEEALKSATADMGNTFFCPEFSMLITRQDWSRDAAWLHFFARAYNYGHTRNDRGHFSYAALGRQWSIYPFGRGGNDHANSYDAHNCSVMTVDNIGTLGQPAKMIDYQDSDMATFATVDLKHSWDWRANGHKNPSDRINPLTQAALQPLDKTPPAWHFVPYSLYPHWREPGKPSGPDLRVPHYPMQYAYRTVGLVRGEHAYAMVMDDMRKDDVPHLYQWNMALPSDVELESVDGGDIVLVERNVGQALLPVPVAGGTDKSVRPTEGVDIRRRLLIRFLQADPSATGSIGIKRVHVEECDGGISWSKGAKRLVVTMMAEEVRAKALLFAYREGTPLPRTIWRGSRLGIGWPGQADVFDFRVDDQGMTTFTMVRKGEERVTLDPVHAPLPGNGPGEGFERGYEGGVQ